MSGMAYLVRRLLENTSNESWLKAGFLDNADPGTLLRATLAREREYEREHARGNADHVTDVGAMAPERHLLSPAPKGVGNGRPFFNESFRDFSVGIERKAFADAVARATIPKVLNDRMPEHGKEIVTKAAAAFWAWRDFDAQAVRC